MSSLSNVLAAALLAGALVLPAAAGAVDVENEDSKEHKVTLTEPGGKQEVTLKAGEKKMDLCAICTVTVQGMQPVQASGLDRVVIKDGKLEKIEQ
jgi:hypothetical protein